MKLKKNFLRGRRTLAELSLLGMALLTVSLVFAANSQINETPKVPISDFQIDKTEVKPGETVKGSFVVKNNETYSVNDINLRLGISKIVKEIETTNEAKTVIEPINEDATSAPIAINRSLSIGSAIVGQSITLGGEASLKKDFSFQLPANLSDGKHFLVVTSFSGRGDIFGVSEEKNINITGGGSFVSITDEKIVSPEGKEYSPGFGLAFDSNIAPKVKFRVKNYGGKASATPQILIYKRAVDDRNFIKKTVEKNITLEANEEKVIEMTLPALEKPMIYLADFRLLDDSGKQLSNLSSFRWAIKGLSPQIIKLNADKASYKKGESAVVDYAIVGSGDTEKRNENGALAIEMVDSKGRVVGNANETVSLDGDGGKANIKLGRSVNGYTLRAKISKGSAELDSYDVKVAGEAEKSVSPFYLAVFILGVLLIGGGVFMFKKNRNKLAKTIALFFLVTVVSFMFSGKAFASRRLYVQTPNEATYNWSAPTADTKYQGDTLNITGTVKMASCSNELVSENYVIYFGKKSGGYASYSLQSFAGPKDGSQGTASSTARNALIASLSPKVNLGSLDGITYNYGGTPGLHYYHKAWTIPSNLPSDYINSDETYVMVIYKGDHINTSGTVVARYRQLAVHKVKILNRAPSVTPVSPGNTTNFNYNSNITLTGRASDADGNNVKMRIRWKKGVSGTYHYSPVFGDVSFLAQPANYSFNIGVVGSPDVYYWDVKARDIYGAETAWIGNWWFRIPSFNLGVSKTGSGTVTSAPAGISCGSDCSEVYASGMNVILTAVPSSGYILYSWGGSCSGASSTCTVVMNQNKSVSAEFREHKITCTLVAEPPWGGTLPLTVRFTGSVIDSFGHPISYTLDFGDSTTPATGTSSSFDINHTYTVNDTYSAILSGSGDTNNTVGCPQTEPFTVNPWSSGDQNEVAP